MMMKSLPLSTFLLLALTITLTLGLATSARVLDEVDPQPPVVDPSEDQLPALPPLVDTPNTLPSGSAPAATDDPDEAVAGGPATTAASADTPAPDQPQPNTSGATTAGSNMGTATTGAPAETPAPEEANQPQPNPAGTGAGSNTAGSTQGAPGATGSPEHPTLSFYMHDVLGGTQASGRIVTGIIATTQVNGIPFSVPNNQVFPVTNGVPILNNNNVNNLINNNNAPFLASLNGQNPSKPQTVFQNAGTNTVVNGGGNNQAFVTPGQLPAGASLQKLLFGSITVIDDELTEGHELGSGVIGKGQGFYLASSLDGESHTMAFTAVFHSEGGEHHDEVGDDTLSFFGVHRTGAPMSQIAIVGGTGKYEYAQGYATIETLPQNDQHTTDGVDTIAHICVYLTE